jgi:UDP-N-acetylmuramoyl-tripeptide--D-alanyl-D-alanine ligase
MMEPTKVETLTRWAGGTLISSDPAATVSVVCTDSRALKAGDFFLALRGENFDGHHFLAEAVKRGATGAVVEEVTGELPADFTIIKVDDTLRALQRIAGEYRRSLDMQVVAITGSNGKTSTKDLTAAALAERFQVTKTEGNFNNHIGLPLTMLNARQSDHFGVFEIGMNHPGEIAPLAALALPNVAIITNIGLAHIEFMGSREAIAQEKGMLAEALDASGTVVLSAEDEFAQSIAARTKADAIFCGIEQGDVRATDLRHDFGGTKFRLHADRQSVEAELPVPGAHMVRNALLATAASRVFGVTLEECAAGFRKLRLTKGRLEQKLVRGVHIIDDTYNANPDSMAAALRTLMQMPAAGSRIAVLGQMGELGAQSEQGHRAVGEFAAQLGVDCVITVGNDARLTAEAAWRGGVAKVVKHATAEEAIESAREMIKAGDVVLVKGSRSARMERIVEGLQRP